MNAPFAEHAARFLVRSYVLGLVLVSVGVASRLEAGTNYAVIVGVDYVPANQKWAQDAINVRDKLVNNAGFNMANIVLLQGNAGAAVTKANVLGSLGGFSGAAMPGDSITFYYSGHGSYFGDMLDPEVVPAAGMAANPCDESLFIESNAQPELGRISDDELTAVFGQYNDGVKKVAFLDSCFSGGFWNGSDMGDLDLIPLSTLIAAADENSTAPGTSDITNNWLGDIVTNGYNPMNMSAADFQALYNRIAPNAVNAPNQKSPPGFPVPGPGSQSDPYDPITDIRSVTEAHPAFFTNVPEPSTLVLAAAGAIGLVLFARKRTRGAA